MLQLKRTRCSRSKHLTNSNRMRDAFNQTHSKQFNLIFLSFVLSLYGGFANTIYLNFFLLFFPKTSSQHQYHPPASKGRNNINHNLKCVCSSSSVAPMYRERNVKGFFLFESRRNNYFCFHVLGVG